MIARLRLALLLLCPLYLSLGEYCFGGKLIGFNARVASTLLLSADDDERLLPVVRLRGA